MARKDYGTSQHSSECMGVFMLSISGAVYQFMSMETQMSRTEERKNRRRSTLIHLAIEIFFAILPLLVLSTVWPEPGQRHPMNFISSPEISMTACVLYGLTLVRFQLGVIAHHRANGMQRALGMTLLSMLPLTGTIISVILITKLVHGTDGTLLVFVQILNLFSSAVLFFVIGGYGISRSQA